jgi:endonuclease-3
MTRRERFQFVLDYFSTHNPDAATELFYDGPYQLLVAVILSAQCTDKRVNMTTPDIFQRYPDARALAKARFDDLFPLIRSISYPNNKTKHLIGMAQMLMEKFGGEVPLTAEKQLIQYIPRDQVHVAHHWLILHGRYVCVARSPKCPQCVLQPACKYFAKNYGKAATVKKQL